MIVATAGHVDHGKTSLVKALTGTETDRLPEEKRRGMTIDLGFAYLPVDGAPDPIGFIDVPGHERFIHNMLSGLSGIDFGLLIVAADDGPMPQTSEHLAILDLLGVRKGLVALTKVDRVAPARVIELERELAERISQTSLAGAPIVRTSIVSGAGLSELKQHLVDSARDLRAAPPAGNFRMTVDRCFTVDGAGLVVTGTVVSGSLRCGDQVRILPGGVGARVRKIHAQNQPAEQCRAGQRCGINLSGSNLKREAITRGTWLVAGTVPDPVPRFDARARILPSEPIPLQHWTPVHVHVGALDVNGRVAVLDGLQIAPGTSGFVQVVLDQPACVVYGDSFILRDQSAQRTIGGGRVVDIFPSVRNRSRQHRLHQLLVCESSPHDEALQSLLALAPEGLRLDHFATNRNLTSEESATLFSRNHLRIAAGIGFTEARWKELKTVLTKGLENRTAANEEGVFLASGYRLPREAAVQIAAELIREGAVVRDALGLRLPVHKPKLSPADEAMWQRVEIVMRKSQFHPPNTSELAGTLREDPKKLESLLTRASRFHLVIRLAANRYILPSTLEQLSEITKQIAQTTQDGSVTAAALRDRIGGGRKVAIEVLEHFDHVKFTRRIGDAHVVIGQGVCYPSNR